MSDTAPEKLIEQNACRFVHLRLHSSYSLLEGAIRAKELPKLCEKNAMPAVAVTDTGNLFGALEFSESLSGAGIQPVTGVTLAVDMDEGPADPIAQQRSTKWEPSGRIALLVKDETGYGNLMKLSTKAFLETDQTLEPHVTVADLEQYAEGLICLTGGPAGPVNRLLAQGQLEAGEAMLSRLHGIYGDRLYVELQRHGLEEEVRAEGPLVDMAYKQGLPLVATNEAYFKTRDEFEAHDALICIAEGSYVSETDRRRLTPEHYFKSQDEMAALFADLPEALENTIEIARRCAYRPLTRNPILPRFDTGDGLTEADELRRQAEEGLKQRLSEIEAVAPEEEYWERLRFELDVIINMDFPGYFLIVSDFIKWAKEHDIPVGPGRGSGAGSLVAYALLITDLDPLRFGLLFERFLNPERVSMPDFDIDFCQDRRDEVIRYVQDKYGYDQVAQIITFGKLQARAVLRDVGRVLQMPYGQVDRLCKLVPNNPANPVTLKEAIDGEPKLREERDREEVVARLLEIGQILEGLYRHASTHAAGVVIGDRKLDELVPLYRDPRSDMPVTQFNMKWVEPAGLVKFDFLGLKTLTVLTTAVKFIEQRSIDIDLSNLPLDDEKTYRLLEKGDTVGVFQLESSGMRDTLRKMKADCLEDIIALVALYRPGPMDNIPSYISRKFGQEKPDYLHEWLKPILEETYGVIIYQEQVMQIAQVLSGYSLGEADLLRRAMGKKIKEEMDKQKVRFVDGAVEKGVPEAQADYIFELVNKFAGYGFNKSHAAAYAYVAYQTAYLKANYPVEFLAASMNLDMNNTDKLNVFKQDAVRLGIEVCSPNVNESEAGFSVKDGKILYALGAIKNVGHQAMEELVAIRREGGPFKDVYDFARRMNPRGINKRMLENLIRAGALDCLNPHRAQLFKSVDTLMALASQAAEERASNQNSLFGDAADSMDSPALAKAEPWMPIEKLNEEFGALGFFLSGHPLDDYQVAMNRAGVVTYQQLVARGNRAEKVAGIVAARRDRRSQRGNAYSFVTLSDATGQFDMVVFSEALNQAGDLLDPGQAVVVNVEIDREGDDVRLRAQSVRAIDAVAADTAAGLKIFLDSAEPLAAVKSRLGERGRGAVSLVLMADGQEVEMALKDRFHVTPAIRGAIRSIPGVVEVQDI
ncbi:DNA polymerase III subunit alpha [Tepidicaulis sp. LMO-SS28]|uniref:DNA polymerase III subunit alpha n=1 Tax=Tepidicaulis sp. LMO-SS28 TaxID=3447455 RepID=UPI003EE3BEF8